MKHFLSPTCIFLRPPWQLLCVNIIWQRRLVGKKSLCFCCYQSLSVLGFLFFTFPVFIILRHYNLWYSFVGCWTLWAKHSFFNYLITRKLTKIVICLNFFPLGILLKNFRYYFLFFLASVVLSSTIFTTEKCNTAGIWQENTTNQKVSSLSKRQNGNYNCKLYMTEQNCEKLIKNC